MKRRPSPARRPQRFAAAAALLALAVAPLAAGAATLDCVPAVQYACGGQECRRTTDDFRHAESFHLDTRTSTLQACLWSQCYSGRARVERGPGGDDATYFGRLRAADPRQTSRPVVSLTIDRERRFVAVWSYRGDGLVFDQGRCVPAPRRP